MRKNGGNNVEFLDKKYRVFRYEHNGKVAYSIGASKKRQDGTYENGFKPIRFKRDIDLKNRTDIIIKEGWEDFYTKDNKTYWYFFINKFELASDMDAMKQVSDNFDKVEELPFY
jgi:hypothetical protein